MKINNTRRQFLGTSLAALVFPVAAAAHNGHDHSNHTQPKPPTGLSNALVIDSDFDYLKKGDGSNFDHRSILGKPTILFFGFASCSDICPTALSNIAIALEDQGLVGKVNVMVVTTQPEHESADMMDVYVRNFSEDFIGLAPIAVDREIFTKSERELRQISAQMEELYTRFKTVRGQSHSPFAYVMDEQGRFMHLIQTQDADIRLNIDKDAHHVEPQQHMHP